MGEVMSPLEAPQPLSVPASPSPHLARVPSAGLGDITLVHSLPAGHATRLILRRGRHTRRHRNPRSPQGLCVPQDTVPAACPAPCSPCSTARRCTWRRGSVCTSCSSCLRSWRIPAGAGGKHVSPLLALLLTAGPGPSSPPASRSRTPRPPPRSRCRTPEGPGAVRERDCCSRGHAAGAGHSTPTPRAPRVG